MKRHGKHSERIEGWGVQIIFDSDRNRKTSKRMKRNGRKIDKYQKGLKNGR